MDFSNSNVGNNLMTEKVYTFSIVSSYSNPTGQDVNVLFTNWFSSTGKQGSKSEYYFYQGDPTTGTPIGYMGFAASGASDKMPIPMSFQSGQIYSLVIDTSYYLPSQRTITSTALSEGTLSITSTDTKPATTPIPAAVWLLGTGLAGMLGIGRKLRKQQRS